MTDVTRPGTRPAYGSLAWAQARDGRLTIGEQLRETARATAKLTTGLPGTVRGLRGRTRADATRLELADIAVPDSTYARAALTEARDSVAAPVVGHSLRTYYWGMALAARDGRSPDPETAYVAALLHDITWGEKYRDFSPMPCFAARGAQAALAWSERVGFPPAQAEVAADAICRHLNVVVGDESSAEARVVADGAGLDVIGARYDELAPETVAAVLAVAPRDDWTATATASLRGEAHPRTRAALLRRLGILQLARRTAFRD